MLYNSNLDPMNHIAVITLYNNLNIVYNRTLFHLYKCLIIFNIFIKLHCTFIISLFSNESIFFAVKYCDIPVNGSNSTLTYTSTFYNSVATYTCEEGFVSNINPKSFVKTAKCMDDKTWSDSALDCQRKYYGKVNEIGKQINIMQLYFQEWSLLCFKITNFLKDCYLRIECFFL